MITISCPMKQEFIISLLDGQTIEGITFKYEGKKGINLLFAHDAQEKDIAMQVAKKAIKATGVGSVLYFQIV